MKRLSRDFTTREKILILVLAIVMVVLCYYQFVFKQVRTTITSNENQVGELQTEADILDAKIIALHQMSDDLTFIKSDALVGSMPSYNSSEQEISLLNDILTPASEYTVAFGDLTREGNLIRRSFTLQYTAADYETARNIITNLAQSEYRCIISDLTFASNDSYSDHIDYGQVTVSANATFYETMTGGTADEALPEDSLATEAEDTSEDTTDTTE